MTARTATVKTSEAKTTAAKAKRPARSASEAPAGTGTAKKVAKKTAKAAPTSKKVAKKAVKKATKKTAAKKTAARKTIAKKAIAKKATTEPGPVIAMAARTAAAAAAGGPRFWLMKSEPEAFSIDDLQRQGVTPWEGVRNYRARNHMRDDMRVGDGVLFYHSSTTPPGVVGLARVASAPYPDASALDPSNPAYDAGSKPDEPRWILVDVAFVEKFAAGLSLDEMRDDPALAGMLVSQKGQRLSVQPVERAHFEHIVRIMQNMQVMRRAGSTHGADFGGAGPSA